MVDGTQVSKVADYVSVSTLSGDTVYCIGTDSEFDWSAAHVYKAWSVQGENKKDWNLNVSATTLYSLYALDADTFFVGDAGDYFNPGTVSCYYKGAKRWSVDAGVCPGHFATY